MAQISPTRMNLIILRKRIKLAEKGHDILKMKRDVLVMEFFKLLKQSRESSSNMNAIIQRAYKTVMIASAYLGNFELKEIVYYIKDAEPVSIRVKNIMGVRIPEIGKGGMAKSQIPISASVAVDDINTAFNEALDSMIDVAEQTQGLRRIVIEIEKTKRRVNALEYVVIPRLNKSRKYISMRLEEMERDMFSALKHVKKKINDKETMTA